MHLAPVTPGQQRLPDLVQTVDRLLGSEETTADIIWRLDAGGDGSETRAQLRDHPGYALLKALSATTAARTALARPVGDGVPVADTIHGIDGIELPAVEGYRRVVYELHQADGSYVGTIGSNLNQFLTAIVTSP